MCIGFHTGLGVKFNARLAKIDTEFVGIRELKSNCYIVGMLPF